MPVLLLEYMDTDVPPKRPQVHQRYRKRELVGICVLWRQILICALTFRLKI